jgi:hypothetical protein
MLPERALERLQQSDEEDNRGSPVVRGDPRRPVRTVPLPTALSVVLIPPLAPPIELVLVLGF